MFGSRQRLEDAVKRGLRRVRPRVTAVAFYDERVLLIRDASGGWELPGGYNLPGERNRDCIRRWFGEQMNIDVTVGGPMGLTGFAGPDGWVPFLAYGCRLRTVEGLRVPDSHQDARLFAVEELETVQMEPAYREAITAWTPEIAAGGLRMKPPNQ